VKKGFIFDVDGVIAETPHEVAWKEALQRLFDTNEKWKRIVRDTRYNPGGFTTSLYREQISGKPRLDGARAALAFFKVPDPDGEFSKEYSIEKQRVFLQKIERGEFKVYEDALQVLLEARRRGIQLVAASSSKNATHILERIFVRDVAAAGDVAPEFIGHQTTMVQLFDSNVCGMDVKKGKPDPEIFIRAASSVGLGPGECLVIEDAVAGIQAAKAGSMFCVGVARLNNEQELKNANADVVTDDLRRVFSCLFDV
jgi:beta-phosphoglucomutase-like phosphatase (HAD superfamily)